MACPGAGGSQQRPGDPQCEHPTSGLKAAGLGSWVASALPKVLQCAAAMGKTSLLLLFLPGL